MHRKFWKIAPFAATLLPIIIEIGFLAFYNSPSSNGVTSNWPSPGSPLQWAQYILLAVTSVNAVIFNVTGIMKSSLTFKIIYSLLLVVSSIILLISIRWLISPTPY